MVIIQALLSWLGQSAGKVLNAVFGWAVVGLFGRSSKRQQAVLSGLILCAVLWPVLVVGIVAPRVVAFLIAFVPPTRSIPSHVLRVIWVMLVVAIPLAISVALAARAPRGARKEPVVWLLVRGFPVTVGLAAAFVIMFVTVPLLRLSSIVRRWSDEHVPLITQGDEIARAADRIDDILAGHALDARRAPPPWWMRVPADVMRALGGRTVATLMPRELFYWRGPTLRVSLYPSDVLVRGPRQRAAWIHGLITESFAHGPGLQTFDSDAQAIEHQIHRIWRVLDAEPDAHRHSPALRARIRSLSRELAARDIDYDEWQLIYRKIAQLARAIEGEPQLMQWAATEDIMEGQQPRPERPLEQASTPHLISQLVHDAVELLKKEMALARAEVREEMKSAIAKMVKMAAAGVCALVGIGLLCTATVLALAHVMAAWLAALLVAIVVFAIAGGLVAAARARTHKAPLERTQRTLKEDVQWARERMA